MATRNLTAGMLTAIADGTVRPALFFKGEYDSGGSPAYLRLWTGVGSITGPDGQTFTGGGQLLGISPIEESTGVQAVGFTVMLSGMPTALISIALASVRQGKAGTLWLGCFDSSGALIADPYEVDTGRFDIILIEDLGETCTIAAQYESRLIDLERSRDRRYTHEDQQIDYPGDNGFDNVASLQDMQILWGGPAAAASTIATPAAPVTLDTLVTQGSVDLGTGGGADSGAAGDGGDGGGGGDGP